MKQVRTTGLTLVAVCALSLIGASAALAMIEKAEFIKGGGGGLNRFTGINKTGVEPKLTATGNTVKCGNDTSTGKVSGNKTMTVGEVVVTFTGCTANPPTNCSVKSPLSGAAGRVVTKPLKGELGRVLTKEAPTTEVGLELVPETGTEFVTLEGTCLTVTPTQVAGHVAGEIRPINKLQTTSELAFELNGTSQKIKKVCLLSAGGVFGGLPCQGGTTGLDEPLLEAFSLPAQESAIEILTFEENTEVHTA